MSSGFSVGYVNFAIFLMLFTGFLNLRLDAKGYKLTNAKKEHKTARFLGWFNVVLAMMVFVGNWVYQSYMW